VGPTAGLGPRQKKGAAGAIIQATTSSERKKAGIVPRFFVLKLRFTASALPPFSIPHDGGASNERTSVLLVDGRRQTDTNHKLCRRSQAKKAFG
jgi:hypothetical protein